MIPDEIDVLLRELVNAGRRNEAVAFLAIEWETPYEAAMRELAANLAEMRRAMAEQILSPVREFAEKLTGLKLQ